MSAVVAKPAQSLFHARGAQSESGARGFSLPPLSEQGTEFLKGLNEIVDEHLPEGTHFWPFENGVNVCQTVTL